MKLFLLGAPGSGKTTLIAPLRERLTIPVLDMDEEVKRANGGVWPSLDVKRALTKGILRDLSLLDDVVLAYSVLDDEGLEVLRDHGWRLVLLDLAEPQLRERLTRREAEQGWTNVEWLPFHLDNISYLRGLAVFDDVVDAAGEPREVVDSLCALVGTPGWTVRMTGYGGGRQRRSESDRTKRGL